MLERKLQFGILGTANIGRAAVIPAIQTSKNGAVAALASREAQKGAEFAARLGIPKVYGSYAALLDDPEIEAVYIPLPNSLHHEWTIKAAQAGKHILCEKPLALNVVQCQEMDAAAKEHGVVLMEAFMYRFHPRTEKVIALVQAEALGPLHLIHSSFTFKLTRPENIRWRADLGGGALMDVGSYCVNISRTLAGTEPVAVQAIARWATSGGDAQLAGTMRFANGLMAQFDCALDLARRESYTAAGAQGYYYVPAAFLPGKDDVPLIEFREREETRHPFTGCDEYQLMVEHFADCILQHEQPRYTALEAAANLRVIEMLYRSARNEGAWQPLPPLT
jgi:D-xylose 1-dehydrogenase (NADP+, D-xylono-1,5-lactone-forming)